MKALSGVADTCRMSPSLQRLLRYLLASGALVYVIRRLREIQAQLAALQQSVQQLRLTAKPEVAGPAPLLTPAKDGPSQEPAFIMEAERLYREHDYAKTRAVLEQERKSAQVLWRLARVCEAEAEAARTDAGVAKASDCPAARELLLEGLGLAREAVELDDKDFATHKWFGIMLSLTAKFNGIKAAIESAFVIRASFERALQINPDEGSVRSPCSHAPPRSTAPTSAALRPAPPLVSDSGPAAAPHLPRQVRHFLGTWCFEVASLSWTQRKLAASLFAAPPTSTYEEAISHFELVEQLEARCPGAARGFMPKNRLLLAKCHLALRQKGAAVRWLDAALALPAVEREAVKANAEARSLRDKL